MKKKLLSIVITLATCLLVGCKNEVDPIYIDSWLYAARDSSEDPNCPTFFLRVNDVSYHSYEDYGLKIRDILLNATNGIEGKKGKAKKDYQGDYLQYFCRARFHGLSSCTIHVYDDNTIVTTACGDGWSAAKDQTLVYKLYRVTSGEIINAEKARYDEIDNTKKAEREAAKEELSIPNFITAVEQSEAIPTLRYCDFSEWVMPTYELNDPNKDILACLKGIAFTPIDDIMIDKAAVISYFINEDWQLRIYRYFSDVDYDIAAIKYKSNSAFKDFYPTYSFFYYSLSIEDGDALENIAINIKDSQ